MTKIAWLDKLPKTFMGGIIGLVFGGIAGGLFAGIGYASYVPWEPIFLFLGAAFGAIIGFKEE